jgi:hypothetical protein
MKSSKKMVFGTWGLEEETKELEYSSELIPILLGIKKHIPSTLTPPPVF